MSRNAPRHQEPLAILELAVDPADVDEETYPVRIRLSRPLSPHETDALAQLAPEVVLEPDAVVLPDAKLDDVAHAAQEWRTMLERAESLAEGLDGQSERAAEEAHRRLTEQHRDLTRDSSVQNYMH